MIQVLPSRAPIGQSVGKGLVETLGPMFQRRIQESELQRALSPMAQPGFESQSYPQQLSHILPALLSQPGGAQLAGELAPIFQNRAQNQAYLNYLNQGKPPTPEGQVEQAFGAGKREPELKVQVEGLPGGEKETYGGRNPSETHLRHPELATSESTTFPKQGLPAQPIPLMTPEEEQQKVQQILTQSALQGNPIAPEKAWGLVQQDQSNRLKYNQQITEDQQRREAAYDKRMSEGLERADREKLVVDPADRDIFERFLDENSGAANSNAQYVAAKNMYRKYNHANTELKRMAQAPNKLEALGQKMIGTYKSKEDIINSIQPQIKIYKELGLLDPLRNTLSGNLGLGPEDIETAIFPPTKEQRNTWNSIKMNPNIPSELAGEVFGQMPKNVKFPGEEFAASPENYQYLKDQIANQLELFPETNLSALRGFLNQQQRWAWTDISKAIDELVDEGTFVPDNIQRDQKFLVDNPPVPSLVGLFKNFWRDQK